MWQPFDWRRDDTGDFVEVRWKQRGMGSGRMVMKTLPALWRSNTDEKPEVLSVTSDSPTQRRTAPAEQLPLQKEQQVVAEKIFATLKDLRGEHGISMPADLRSNHIHLLDVASLDILDACLNAAELTKIKDVVVGMTCRGLRSRGQGLRALAWPAYARRGAACLGMAGVRAARLMACAVTSPSSDLTDHRPSGPEEKEEPVPDKEGEKPPAEPAPAPTPTEEKGDEKKDQQRKPNRRGGWRRNADKERTDCPICWRPVTNSEVGMAMHQASKYCLTWRFRQEGYGKWQAEKMAAEEEQKAWMKWTKPNVPRSRSRTRQPRKSRSDSRRRRRRDVEAEEEEMRRRERQKRKEREARARADEEDADFRRRRAQEERDREERRHAERQLEKQRAHDEARLRAEEDPDRRRREREKQRDREARLIAQEEARRQRDRAARLRAQEGTEKKTEKRQRSPQHPATAAVPPNAEKKESSSDSYYSSSSEEQNAAKNKSVPKTGQAAAKSQPAKIQQAAPKLPAAPARQVQQPPRSQPVAAAPSGSAVTTVAAAPSGSAGTTETGINMVERLLKTAINEGFKILGNEPAGCKKE
eukprot:s4420_g3.t1